MTTVRDATHEDLPGIPSIYDEVIRNSTAVYSVGFKFGRWLDLKFLGLSL
jgi:L-amino acid N-acyltransferase YncA